MKKSYYVYILTNYSNTVLYIGVTSNLLRRISEHKEGKIEGFTKKYKLKKLVHIEETNDVMAALEREKQLKRWRREWKWNLVKEENPKLIDLSVEWYD